MRIRYTKEGGVEAELPDAAARRLIASGQAEAVRQAAAEAAPKAEPGRKPAAKKSARGSK